MTSLRLPIGVGLPCLLLRMLSLEREPHLLFGIGGGRRRSLFLLLFVHVRSLSARVDRQPDKRPRV